jgi:hypothetical protein
MAEEILPPFSVEQAIIDCGVPINIMFNGSTQAQRIASDLFDDDFNSCIDKTNEELDEDFKDYSSLTVANGQIRLAPATKKNIKAFLQWTKHKLRINENPQMERLPINDANNILQRYKMHKAYIDKSKTISETAKPEQFTDKIKWTDWVPTFRNFLRTIPGRNGVPLSYIIRDENDDIRNDYTNFLEEYIDKANLHGAAFITDAAEVHTYVTKFITNNDVAESKLSAIADQNDGRQDFLTLKDHYEGIGVNALDVTRADRLLETLFYSGEKKPNMWWTLFEKLLNEAFTIYNRKEGREVHSEHMKLRILCKKVTADFLPTAKATVQLQLAKDPITITYDEALASFRNQVNLKYPPELSSQSNRSRTRRISEFTTRGGRGRGRFGRGGRGRHGRGRGGRGRGRNSNGRRPRTDTRMVKCTDGTEVESHASFKFSDEVWAVLPEAERNRILQEREEYKRRRYNGNSDDRSTISQITMADLQSVNQSMSNLQQQISTLTSQANNNQENNESPPTSIMGGRNEQANLRTRSNNNN